MPNTPKVATLADLQKNRELVAEGPSGLAYKLRPMNLERYALSGHMPSGLRDVALKGADGVNEVLGSDSAVIAEKGSEVRDWMDDLVRRVVVAPNLANTDLDDLPPVDYRWIVAIALGEEDRDGQGRRLWGREPLSAWSRFRDEHGCGEDCPSCDRLRRSVADIHRGRGD